jgi:hypothetical protein
MASQWLDIASLCCVVHWRFEEHSCGKEHLGRCFVRCGDGAIVNTGLHSLAEEWRDSSKDECRSHAVKVTTEDLVGAIYDRCSEKNLGTVYLATDGWIRGHEGSKLVTEV